MRLSPIKNLLIDRGANFKERAGVEIATDFGDVSKEYSAVREGVGLSDFSFMTRHKVSEEGLDMLEQYAAGSAANIRFGRVLHTMALDEQGMIESDLYIANDDEFMIVLGESLIDDARTDEILAELGGEEAGIEDLSKSTVVFGLDGCNAWAVAKDLFGSDVLGLPYLSIENYDLFDSEIKLIRGGKTSEFGYLLIVPVEISVKVWEALEKTGEKHGLKPVGTSAHSALRLDGRFFNIHEEGSRVRDPLPLGLQWMVDMEGDSFRGSEALMERRGVGLTKKIIGIVPQDKETSLALNQPIFHASDVVASVVATAWSPTLNTHIGLASFNIEFAYAGLNFVDGNGKKITTVSMPPFTSKSLSIKLDEM